MKTQEAVELLVRNGWHKDGAIEIVEEIQCDAREGMVPVEDVRPLVNALHVIAAYSEGPEVTGAFDEPASANLARIALSEEFRAKHPELFKT